MVKLLSIMVGTCGTLGLDLRGVVIDIAGAAATVVVVVVDVDVSVAVVIGSVTFDFFSLDNI